MTTADTQKYRMSYAKTDIEFGKPRKAENMTAEIPRWKSQMPVLPQMGERAAPIPVSTFVPSEYQQAFFDWVKSGRGNAIIDAKAGSGKTTTLAESLKVLPSGQSIVFLAFNKSVQLALQAKVAATHPHLISSIRTLNSLGHQTWGRHVGAKLNVDASKSRTLVDTVNKYGRMYSKPAADLCRLAKAVGIVPSEAGSGLFSLIEDSPNNWYAMLNQIDADDEAEDEKIIEIAKEALVKSIAEQTWIDFDDQFYMPIIYGARFQPYNWVLVDEAQDVSYIQQEVIARSFGPATRFVGIGDVRQAIYAWRGASSASLYEMRDRFECATFDLPVSYRCPLSVIRLAQQIVPEILPKPDAKEGKITNLGTKFLATDFDQKDLVICRNNAPLVDLAYKLWSAKVQCCIVGKAIGVELVKLIKSLRPISLKDLGNKMDMWQEKEVRKALKRNPNADLDRVNEKHDIVTTFLSVADVETVDELCWEIENLFGDGADGRLRLSSVHRAKGMQAPKVFILNKYLMPSKMAKQDWQIQQEMNILYVAITRAMDELIFIDDGKENTRGNK